jgi:pimeloyl-ACP methyl ester carboxylesterase
MSQETAEGEAHTSTNPMAKTRVLLLALAVGAALAAGAEGQAARGEALAGLAVLRALPEVDPDRVTVAGHSFGGSLTLLVAEHDSSLRSAVVFAPAGYSWERSPRLRARLRAAVGTEMARLGEPHRVKIYPPVGRTAEEGHDIVHLGVATWEPDVFAFLDEHVRR